MLDYICCNPCLIDSSFLDWTIFESDHALLAVNAKSRFNVKVRPKKTWNPDSLDTCIDALQALDLFRLKSVIALESQLHIVQSAYGCRKTCKERRQLRMPLDLRTLYARKQLTTDEEDKRNLVRLIRARRTAWIKQLRDTTAIQRISAGRILGKSKKLHSLECVEDDFQVSADKQECAVMLAEAFSKKWGSDDAPLLKELHDILLRHDGDRVHVELQELSDAFKAIRNRNRVDSNGIAVKTYELLFTAQPDAFLVWFISQVSSMAAMAECSLSALAFGKEGSHAKTSSVRVIVPQTAFLQLADVVLSVKLQTFLATQFRPSKFVFEGARPRTQSMDIVFGIALLVEKSLDLRSEGAVAQLDVKQHYDTLSCMLIYKWLVSHGFPPSYATACLRHQLLPSISIKVASFAAMLGQRSKGALTGSRVAGQLGRIPVQATLLDLHDVLCKLSWNFDDVALVAASFVDNVYFAGGSPYKAAQMGDLFAQRLLSQWGQSVKQGSQQVLVMHGAHDDSTSSLD